MLGFTKQSLSILLVAAASFAFIAPISVVIAQDCTDVGASSDGKLADAAKRLIETLRPLAEGAEASNAETPSLEDLFEVAKNIFNEKQDEANTSTTKDNKKPKRDDRWYADRYVQGVLDILEDEECMSGTLDVSSPDFTADEAIRVFQKCRLVHLRNFFPTDFLKDYKRGITSYVTGVANGRISEQGQTSYAGETYYFGENAKHRFDLCFTEDLLNEEIMASKLLLEVLEDEMVLDHTALMLDFGAILAEPGAPLQDWHRDGGDYLFARSFRTSGVAGHDLPPFAVAVITPLLNVTMEHGPTEFCMGFSNLVGLEKERPGRVPVKDPELRKKLDEFLGYFNACPAEAWRTPILNFGDVLLFDYNMLHRGGPNNSPDLRALIYNTYVRNWYKDPNWSQPNKAKHAKTSADSPLAKFSESMQRISRNVRLAIPDEIKPEDPDVLANTKFDDLEKLKQFRPSHFAEIFENDDDDDDEEDFYVTNVDIDIKGLKLCFDNDRCFALPKGEDLFVTADSGEILRIVDPSGKKIKEFTVTPYQKQVILSSLNTEF
eukprot:CAMPEP_0195297886 /NCGR_PEP_ID=MMETSP0707-20130614/22319_1 /TAXON_ID=33640 /ORGANISM="Asterionellopsis glacialis, Strain CCMP134" /LENGTH=547 /DNA_ID=CAMNT_0040359809 /DNA_START=9 /DNA_END=1652 /DNA_ORIENTATION=+